MLKVVWLAINYNSADSLRCLLESLGKLRDLEVIVVDNGKPEAQQVIDSLSHLQDLKATVLVPDDNLGYFGGARAALSHYLQQAEIPDYVVVSNVDLTVEESLLSKLETAQYPADTGVIGPSIRSSKDGNDLNPQYRCRPSRKKMQWFKRISQNRLLLNLYIIGSCLKRLISKRRPIQLPSVLSPEEVYSVHGSCLIFTRKYFAAGGSLDHEPFLFGEEITVAERCRALGLKAVYDPTICVLHEEHETTGTIRSRRIAGYQAEAARYIADTYFP